MSKEKIKVRRTITLEEIESIAQRLIEDCKDMNDGDSIDAVDLARQYNISSSIFNKVYIRAFQKGLKRVVFKQKVGKADPPSISKLPQINKRGNLMIGGNTVRKLNEGYAETHQFKQDDSFECVREGDKIILTLKK